MRLKDPKLAQIQKIAKDKLEYKQRQARKAQNTALGIEPAKYISRSDLKAGIGKRIKTKLGESWAEKRKRKQREVDLAYSEASRKRA